MLCIRCSNAKIVLLCLCLIGTSEGRGDDLRRKIDWGSDSIHSQLLDYYSTFTIETLPLFSAHQPSCERSIFSRPRSEPHWLARTCRSVDSTADESFDELVSMQRGEEVEVKGVVGGREESTG